MKDYELSQNHWVSEECTERMTVANWRKILLDERDRIIFHGNCRRLVAKRLGAGIVEVSKAPDDGKGWRK